MSIAALASLLALIGPPLEPEHPLWGELEPGPHAVGFTSLWELDHGRTYATAFDGNATYGAEKAPRPILVDLWYPAVTDRSTPPMPYGDYLRIDAEDARIRPLSAALATYARGVVVQELFGAAEPELDDADRALLERLLAMPTACRRDATPAAGPFPLVVYHSGAGSSFEDNAVLCEYLASHGYVVVGSAYPKADGSRLGTDGRDGSARDMEFLVRHARTLPFVDWRRIGLAGHSLGAQAALLYASLPDCVADAVVSLDTTQDYYGLSVPMHASLVARTTENVEHLTEPLLICAAPEACFQLCDTFRHAERTYLTVPELGHDEYISQGMLRLRIERSRAGEAESETSRLARGRYEAVCEFVRLFLDAHLGGRPQAFDERAREYERTVLGAPSLHVERVPAGVDAPPAYDVEGSLPPTPRQLPHLVAAHGVETTRTVLERFRDHEPRSPIYASTMLTGSLLYDLVDRGEEQDARALYGYLVELQPKLLWIFRFLSDVAVAGGKLDDAVRVLRVAAVLDPDDAETAERLRELEAGRRD